MTEEYVSLKHLAEELGMDRSHARRYVLRLGIKPHKRRTPDSHNQLTLAVDQDEADIIREKRREDGFVGDSKPVAKDVGEFYIIRLVPELDNRRVKMGFAVVFFLDAILPHGKSWQMPIVFLGAFAAAGAAGVAGVAGMRAIGPKQAILQSEIKHPLDPG